MTWRQASTVKNFFVKFSGGLELFQVLDRFPDNVCLWVYGKPEVRIGFSKGQAKQGLCHAAFFSTHNHALMLHGNVCKYLFDVDRLLGTGTRLCCSTGSRVARALRHHVADAKVGIFSHERNVVLEHVAPALNRAVILNLVINQHVLHLGPSLVHEHCNSFQILFLLSIKVAHVLQGGARLIAGTGLVHILGVALCDNSVCFRNVAH